MSRYFESVPYDLLTSSFIQESRTACELHDLPDRDLPRDVDTHNDSSLLVLNTLHLALAFVPVGFVTYRNLTLTLEIFRSTVYTQAAATSPYLHNSTSITFHFE